MSIPSIVFDPVNGPSISIMNTDGLTTSSLSINSAGQLSVVGTSSTATGMDSSSYASTASYVATASYALSATATLPAGTVSSSAQVVSNIANQQIAPTGITSSLLGTASYALSATATLPAGTVSSSAQVLHGTNIVSSSTQVISNISGQQISPSGVTSSLYGTSSWASNVTTASYVVWSSVDEKNTDTFAGTASYTISASYATFSPNTRSTSIFTTNGGTITFTSTSSAYTVLNGTLNQTIVLPDATTIPLGLVYEIDNNSTGLITVQSNGGTVLKVLAPSTDGRIILMGNTAASGSWNFDYYGSIISSADSVTYNDNVVFPINKIGSGGTMIIDQTGSITYAPGAMPMVSWLEIFGHSYFDLSYGGTGASISGITTNYQGMPQVLLPTALGLNRNRVRNHAVVSSRLTGQTRQGGGFPKFLGEITRTKKTYPFSRAGGLHIGCWGINDVGNSAVNNLALMSSSYTASLDTFISLCRSSAIYPAVSGGGLPWTFGTNWKSGSSANLDWGSVAGVTCSITDTAGSSTALFTIPLGYQGEPISFLLIGTSASAAGVVTWTGSLTGTTNILGTTTNLSSVTNDIHGPIVVRFTSGSHGLSPYNAGQTIGPKVTTVNGTVQLDSVWIESFKPDPVIICNVPKAGCTFVSMSLGDGITNGANAQFTSSTAQFTGSTDSGSFITEMDAQGAFTAGKTILSVQNASNITLSGNAAAAKTNVQFVFGRKQNGYATNYSTNTHFSGATPLSHSAADADVDALNAVIRTVVGKYDQMVQLADIDSAFGHDANLPYNVISYYATDGLHPNDLGSSRIVSAIVQAIAKLAPAATDFSPLQWVETQASQVSLADSKRNIIRSGQVYLPEFGAWTASYSASAGDMFALPMYITEPTLQIQQVVVEQMNASSASFSKWGIYDDINYNGYPQVLRGDYTGVGFANGTTAGVKTICSPYALLHNGLYWFVFKVDSVGTLAPAFRSITGPNSYMPSWSTSGGQIAPIAWKLTAQGSGSAMPSIFPTGAVVTSQAPAVGLYLVVQ